jgi:hypothetical protein
MKEIKVKGFSFNEILNFGPVFIILGFILYMDFKMLSMTEPLEGVVLKVVVAFNLLALPLIIAFVSKLTESVVIDSNGVHKKTIIGSKNFSWSVIKKFEVALETKRAEPVFLNENEHLENFINGVKIVYISKTNPIVLKKWWQKDDNTISIPFRKDAYEFIREKVS